MKKTLLLFLLFCGVACSQPAPIKSFEFHINCQKLGQLLNVNTQSDDIGCFVPRVNKIQDLPLMIETKGELVRIIILLELQRAKK